MNGMAWTTDETSKLRRLVAAGLTDGQIGEKLGRDRIVVCRKRNALDLKPGQTSAMTSALRRIRARKMRIEAGAKGAVSVPIVEMLGEEGA